MENGIILQLILFAVWFPTQNAKTNWQWMISALLSTDPTQILPQIFSVCFFDTTEWKKLPVRSLNSKLNSKPEHPSESDF